MITLATDKLLRHWHTPPGGKSTQSSHGYKCAHLPQSIGTALSLGHMIRKSPSLSERLLNRVQYFIRTQRNMCHFFCKKRPPSNTQYFDKANASKKCDQQSYHTFNYTKTRKLTQRHQFYGKYFLTQCIEPIFFHLRRMSAPDAFFQDRSGTDVAA